MKLSKMIIPIIVGLAVGAGVFMLILGQEKKTIESPVSSKKSILAAPSSAPAKLLTWTDPAGFIFQYPEGLTVNKHDEDNDNYAHIEFTSKNHPGGLIVWAKDLPAGKAGTSTTDLSVWIKADKRFAGGNVIDTTFAGKPGEKILLTTPSAMIVSGTIDDNILFTVEATLTDKEYWSKVHETIAGSFTFTTGNSAKNAGTGSDNSSVGEGAVDEEELVQ